MVSLERRATHEGAGFTGEGNQRTGLEALHARDLANVFERGLATNVNHLATDHAGETHRLRETQDEVGAHMRIGMCFVRSEQREGVCQKRVARQDCGGLVELAMHRRLAATHIVIVHCRQVVVDQRIGVYAFNGGCDAGERPAVDAELATGLQNEKRADALAATQRGVAHGLDHPRLRTYGLRQDFLQHVFHQEGGFVQRGLDR
jgi:hypothetical protein